MSYDPSKRQRLISLNVKELPEDDRVWLHVDTTLTVLFTCEMGLTKQTAVMRYTAVLEWLAGYAESRAIGSQELDENPHELFRKLSEVLEDEAAKKLEQRQHELLDLDISMQVKASDIFRHALREMNLLAEDYERRRPKR